LSVISLCSVIVESYLPFPFGCSYLLAIPQGMKGWVSQQLYQLWVVLSVWRVAQC